MELSGLEVGSLSLLLILALVYLGMHIATALAAVSFAGVWLLKGNAVVALKLLVLSAGDSISSYAFGVVPLFILMGMFVNCAELGRDAYAVAHNLFRKSRGGLGHATVAANAVFAAITGISIASAAVFTRVAVPEMLRFGHSKRFAVGVVAGSSVLGMLIPPSVLLIVYALIAQQSVADLFTAAIIPGILLATAFSVGIALLATFYPRFVHDPAYVGTVSAVPSAGLPLPTMLRLIAPIGVLILLVLGGIYGGFFTPTEAGAVGAGMAMIIALIRRRLSWPSFWQMLVEAGHVTASILFLIIAASMYSRMLGVTGIPTLLGDWMAEMNIGFQGTMAVYVVLMVLMGTVIDSTSIMLICAPLFLPVIIGFGGDPVWFGIVTVIGAEIGLLTPPLGISCFVVKGALDDRTISLNDIFAGAAPFAAIMLLVLVTLIQFPVISLALVK